MAAINNHARTRDNVLARNDRNFMRVERETGT